MKKFSLVISVSSVVLFAASGVSGQKMALREAHAAVVEMTQEAAPPAAAVVEQKPAVQEISPTVVEEVAAETVVETKKEAVSEAAVIVEEKPAAQETSPTTVPAAQPAEEAVEAVEADQPASVRRVRPRGRYEMSAEDWDVYRAKREENLLKRAEEREARVAERYEELRKRAEEGDNYLTAHWDEMIEEAKKRREKMLEESRARQQKLLKQHDEMAKRARERQLQIAELREKLDTMSPEERRVYMDAHREQLAEILGETGEEPWGFRQGPAGPRGGYGRPYQLDPYDYGQYQYGYGRYPIPPGY